MEIRPARLDDAGGIADVHVRTWQSAYEHVFGAERLATVTVERRLPIWKEILNEDDTTAFVAEDDGRIVGFATVGPSREDDADGELYAIYVEPEAWGTAAGPALIQAGVGVLRDCGFRDAVLWVLEDNPRARRFYEREGWSLDGNRREGEHLGVATVEVRYGIRF
ncbi:MAG TPA: GNAT family N-acetyltransferase [Gaiellaceae bacterium]|nr:GNAT family N-acetyltransferase [Gaiellaceae bacterium]